MNQNDRQPLTPPGVSFRRVSYEADSRQQPHHHELTSLTLLFQGSLDEIVGRAQEQAGPLSMVYKPAGTEHANRVGATGATTFQLEFEGEFFPEERPEDWRWTHGGRSAREFLGLIQGLLSGVDDPVQSEARLFDVVAHVFADQTGEYRDPPAWLASVVEEIEDTYRDPRPVRLLARDASVHPVALARAHRRHFGCSLTDRIRRLRVRETAARLAGREPLGSIAFAAGFSDQPHMTRVFRNEMGVTPGAYRSLIG